MAIEDTCRPPFPEKRAASGDPSADGMHQGGRATPWSPGVCTPCRPTV